MSEFKSQIFNFRSQVLLPMPTYQRFEDLPVWQAAADLYGWVDDWLENAPPRLSRSFRDQLERATLSVSNNIAEGFERGTTNELIAPAAPQVRSVPCSQCLAAANGFPPI